MKKSIARILSLVLVLSLMIAGTSFCMAEEQPYIIWVNPLVGAPVFTAADNGMIAASEEFGFKLKIIGPSVLDDMQMYQAIESAIVEQPDLIVTTPYNYTAIASLYETAAEKGIPIIDISSDSGEASGRVCFIGTDNTTYGQLAADCVNEKMGGKAKVLTMMGNLDTSNQLEQRLAFEEKCAAEYPGIETIMVDEDNCDAGIALQKFSDDLKLHPEIDLIFCLEGNGGAAAALACQELGITGQVQILAIDDNADTLEFIRNGEIWATFAQNFYKMGYLAGKLAMDHLSGVAVESTYDSGTTLITAETLDAYLAG